MRLALPGRIGFFRTRGCLLVRRVLGQDIFLVGSKHESSKIVDKPLSIFQPGWLVPEATKPTKATLKTEMVPFEMTIDYRRASCFFSANLLQLVQNESYKLPEADTTESKDAKDRDAVVTKKSEKSTDVDTDKNLTQEVWRKHEEKPKSHLLDLTPCTVRARRLREAQPRHVSHGGKKQATRILQASQGDKDSLDTTMRLLAGLVLATACPMKARKTRRAQARSAPRSFTVVCTIDAALVGFVDIDKASPSLHVRAVSDWWCISDCEWSHSAGRHTDASPPSSSASAPTSPSTRSFVVHESRFRQSVGFERTRMTFSLVAGDLARTRRTSHSRRVAHR